MRPSTGASPSFPQPRVVLCPSLVATFVLRPVLASLVKLVSLRRGRDLALPLEELYTQAHGHVESLGRQRAQCIRQGTYDVAVHEPGAWIVRLKRKDKPTAGRQEGNVTAQGVLEVDLAAIA